MSSGDGKGQASSSSPPSSSAAAAAGVTPVREYCTFVNAASHSSAADEEAPAPAERTSCISKFLILCCVIGAAERWAYFQYMADIAPIPVNNINDRSFCNMYDNRSVLLSDMLAVQSDSIIHAVAFIMPVVGGVIADRCIGRVKTIQISSVLYVVAAIITVCAVYIPHACSAVPLILSHVLITCGAGLIKPSLLVLTIEAGQVQHNWSVTTGCLTFYLFLAIGQTCGYACAYAGDRLAFPLAFAILVVALVKFGASCCYTNEDDQLNLAEYRSISNPIWRKYYQIAAVYVPVTWAITLSCYTLAGFELTHYTHRSIHAVLHVGRNEYRSNVDFAILLDSVGILATIPLLMLLNCRRPLMSTITRSSIGICIAAAAQVAAGIANLLDSNTHKLSELQLRAFYGCLAFAYGICEGLTIASINEMSYKIASNAVRTLVCGFFITVWTSGFLFSTLTQIIFKCFINAQAHRPPTKWLYILLLVLLLLSLLLLHCKAKICYYDLCYVFRDTWTVTHQYAAIINHGEGEGEDQRGELLSSFTR